jgi:NAD(P)H-dependent flavin oxidoreductase YrpB (nitropropane dioxygenase family)
VTHDPLSTPLTQMLGCRWPVIQTAMGWVSTPRLVIASSQAGAFGFLAAAVMTPAEAEAAIAEVRGGTGVPFGVNFHAFQPGAERIVDLVLANRDQVRAVSFGRGPDAKMIARFKAAGILCVPTIGAVKHAQKMVELGVDMLVVQGGEGGGHTGSVATTVLLPQVLDSVDIPVVAAGGFADGRGLAAALAWGACGIAMGTRFLMTAESPVPAATMERYLAAGAADITVTDKVDGIPQRMIRNRMLARIERGGGLGRAGRAISSGLAMKRATGASFSTLLKGARGMSGHGGLSLAQAMSAAAAPALIQCAMVAGDPEQGLMATGQVAVRVGERPTCQALVDSIVAEARARIAALSGNPLQAEHA